MILECIRRKRSELSNDILIVKNGCKNVEKSHFKQGLQLTFCSCAGADTALKDTRSSTGSQGRLATIEI